MSTKLYYTAPSQEVFDEIRREASKIWRSYDNEYGYVDEKIGRIESLLNVEDNWMYMIAMFDHVNHEKLMSNLSPTTVRLVEEAIAP